MGQSFSYFIENSMIYLKQVIININHGLIYMKESNYRCTYNIDKLDKYSEFFNYEINDRLTYDPSCLHKITINDFVVDDILPELNDSDLSTNDKHKIISILCYYDQNKEKLQIKKMDGLIFYKGGLPLLEIYNSNAIMCLQKKKSSEEKFSYTLSCNINNWIIDDQFDI